MLNERREWKISNRAVFVLVRKVDRFTRAARVARVVWWVGRNSLSFTHGPM
jgi:hypothetical protein